MIVADTSALLSLATGEVIALTLDEFDVFTTQTVVGELDNTSAYDDRHGSAASLVLEHRESLSVQSVKAPPVTSDRIDEGEGSCVELTRSLDADFLLTDDLRAVPELQSLADARVAISPLVLRILVDRNVVDTDEAKARLERIGERRDWLGAPIYRRARRLFE